MSKKTLDMDLDDLLSDINLPNDNELKEETRRLKLSVSVRQTLEKPST